MSNRIIIPMNEYGVTQVSSPVDQHNLVLELKDSADVSDGYHTFGELYYYRVLLQAAWFNSMADHETWGFGEHKSWRHSDGELCFGKDNYFIVVAKLPTGQITNHYEGKYWDLFKIPSRRTANKWDGHTPEEAAKRIEKYLKGAWS